jgi:hypothetical protein
MREVTADQLKSDAVVYINRQFERILHGNPNRQQLSVVGPILKLGDTRDLVILLMCGFAAQVAEQALKD